MQQQTSLVGTKEPTARTPKNARIAAIGVAAVALLGAVAAVTAVARAAPDPPAAPDAPIVLDLGAGVAEVMWLDVDFEDGYDVQREKRKSNGSWFKTKIVATVGANVTTIEDGAGIGTFRYRVRAFNIDGDSAWSGWTEVTLADGGGGDPPPDIWIAWYVYPPEFVPTAPIVENMGPQLDCVVNGETGPAALLWLLGEEGGAHFSQGRWPDGPHPCESCSTCGMTVTPTDVCDNGAPTYPIDRSYAFHLTSDGTGAIWFDFRGSGDPPGPKKSKRFQSVMVPVQDVVWDDPNDQENSAFTLEIREPCLLLDHQTGPSDPRYISIGDIRFEKWTAP